MTPAEKRPGAGAGPRLGEYRRKRDFTRTSEPAGDDAPLPEPSAPRFVVQRHRARRLHYDFRLEIDGVLVSWAVPKGLTLDPKARRLAVHVEDHPLEYFDFEGVIPTGEYGAGDVIVWDQGVWDLHKEPDARRAVEDGELHLELHGEKLRGGFVLVRTDRDAGDRERWIVLHKRDEHAIDGWDPEEHPRSVLSGRTNDDVKADPDRLWTREGEAVLRPPIPELSGPDEDELAALEALGEKGTWTFQGRDLALTNLDKVLFPPRDGGDAVTKRDFVRFAARIAPVMLPYLLDRPLNLLRAPDGVGGKSFWQKQAPSYAPEWIPRWLDSEAEPGETEEHLMADSPPVLAWLANHAAVELHAWTSRLPGLEMPTYALVDIDPGDDTSRDDLLTLARLHRTALEHLGVVGFPKVSGRRGIQVWIPIAPGPTFAEVRAWVEQLSRTIGKVVPDLVSWTWEKRSRDGRARLDYTQNARHKTLVAPYSVRAVAGATVSVPIEWDELDDPAFAPDRWTIRSLEDRLEAVGDPMAPMLRMAQSLPVLDEG